MNGGVSVVFFPPPPSVSQSVGVVFVILPDDGDKEDDDLCSVCWNNDRPSNGDSVGVVVVVSLGIVSVAGC